MSTLRIRQHDLLWRDIDGEIVILDLERSLYASVNAAGRLLWLALTAGASEADLEAALTAEYGLPPDAARRDVAEFLAMLREQGLLAP